MSNNHNHQHNAQYLEKRGTDHLRIRERNIPSLHDNAIAHLRELGYTTSTPHPMKYPHSFIDECVPIIASLAVGAQSKVDPRNTYDGKVWRVNAPFWKKHIPKSAQYLDDYCKNINNVYHHQRPIIAIASYIKVWFIKQSQITMVTGFNQSRDRSLMKSSTLTKGWKHLQEVLTSAVHHELDLAQMRSDLKRKKKENEDHEQNKTKKKNSNIYRINGEEFAHVFVDRCDHLLQQLKDKLPMPFTTNNQENEKSEALSSEFTEDEMEVEDDDIKNTMHQPSPPIQHPVIINGYNDDINNSNSDAETVHNNGYKPSRGGRHNGASARYRHNPMDLWREYNYLMQKRDVDSVY